MDYLIAVAMALVGLIIMWFLFSSVGDATVSIGEVVKAPQPIAPNKPEERSNGSKRRKPKAKSTEHDDTDAVLDALVAQELARNQSGMSVDSKAIQPPTLQLGGAARNSSRKNRRQAKEVVNEVNERQLRIDRELGFKTVGAPTREKANRKQKQPQQMLNVDQDDEMERKLSSFFRNGPKKNKFLDRLPTADEAPATSVGARVVVKKDISHARSW